MHGCSDQMLQFVNAAEHMTISETSATIQIHLLHFLYVDSVALPYHLLVVSSISPALWHALSTVK